MNDKIEGLSAGNHNPRAVNSQTFMSRFQREIYYIPYAYYVGFQRSAVSLKYTYIYITNTDMQFAYCYDVLQRRTFMITSTPFFFSFLVKLIN